MTNRAIKFNASTTRLIDFDPSWVGTTGLFTELLEHIPITDLYGVKQLGSYHVETREGIEVLTFTIRNGTVVQQLPKNHVAYVEIDTASIFSRKTEATGRPLVTFKKCVAVYKGDDGYTVSPAVWHLSDYTKVAYPSERWEPCLIPAYAGAALLDMSHVFSTMVHAAERTLEFLGVTDDTQACLKAQLEVSEMRKMASEMLRHCPDPSVVNGSSGTLPPRLLGEFSALKSWYGIDLNLPEQPFDRFKINAAHFHACEVALNFHPPEAVDPAMTSPAHELKAFKAASYLQAVAALHDRLGAFSKLFLELVPTNVSYVASLKA